MLRSLIVYMACMHGLGQVPYDVSLHTYLAAERRGVDRAEMGAYLITEHGKDWTERPDHCGDTDIIETGTCGVYNLAPLWVRYCRPEAPLSVRFDIAASADIAACLFEYTLESHEDCSGPHDWRAHLKASPAARDEVKTVLWLTYAHDIRTCEESWPGNFFPSY